MKILDDERAPRRKEIASMSWRDWFFREFLRYLYGALCLFLDILILGEIRMLAPTDETSLVYFIMALVIAIVSLAQYKVYTILWGRREAGVAHHRF